MQDSLLRAEEVAALLQIHPKTVYAMADRGEIPVVRLGRRAVRFRRADVAQLVADRLVPGKST